jgi:ADP-ribose pyrophosphatase
MTESLDKDNRWYPRQPLVGVGAVVIENGQILMIRRSKEPSKGKWSIPGGMVELGETLYEAASREVNEECSIKIRIKRVLDATDTILRDDNGRIKYHFILVDMLAGYVSGEVKAQSDAEECRWFTPEEIKGLDIPPSLRDMFKRQNILNMIKRPDK